MSKLEKVIDDGIPPILKKPQLTGKELHDFLYSWGLVEPKEWSKSDQKRYNAMAAELKKLKGE